MKSDIIVSQGGTICFLVSLLLLLPHLLFSLSVSRLVKSGKIRSEPFHKFVFPLFQLLQKFFFVGVVFNLYYFFKATAQHPRHIDDKEGSRKMGGARQVIY